MASFKCSLPSLKLTRRPTIGQKGLQILHRRGLEPYDFYIKSNNEDTNSERGINQSDDECSFAEDYNYMPEPELHAEEPTAYKLECQASIAGWNLIRKQMLDAVTESAAMPSMEICHYCNESSANVRCQQCGPLGLFCLSCFKKIHSSYNIFHIGEKWEDYHYIPLFDDRVIDIRPNHHCLQKRSVIIHCVDEFGIIHQLLFTHCSCEPVMVTLARADLWPATPHNPRFAFAFSLLDWAEALMLECQVALKDFCSALKFRCPFNASMICRQKDIYSSLIDSFEEYRLLKHHLRHLNYLCEGLDEGNVCPACPQNGGKVVYALDALFGLPRKKSAGVSYRGPLHGELFFYEQSPVDQFLIECENLKTSSSNCNDFLAGSMLRSANRYKALDETAVFGYCCRHEFPHKFISLKHGERLAYAVWVLNRILSDKEQLKENNSIVYVMYDVACTLFKHLKSIGRFEILENINLCLPTFHSYGHKVSCQIIFGPRRCKGIGLSDGETMERLWSYLRRYSRMTKEMRPSHRIDVLTSALVYYGILRKENLGSLILTRWDRALKSKSLAEESLQEKMANIGISNFETIEEWLSEEVTSCADATAIRPVQQWKLCYFETLQAYYSIRKHIPFVDQDENTSEQHSMLNKKLEEIEKCHLVLHRWLPTDKDYIDCEQAVRFNKQESLLLQLLKASQ
jgi:hypothetical protein